jgi:hypothetical protein
MDMWPHWRAVRLTLKYCTARIKAGAFQQDVPLAAQQANVIPAAEEVEPVKLQVPFAPDTHSGVMGPVPHVWSAQTGSSPNEARQTCPAAQLRVMAPLKLTHFTGAHAAVVTIQYPLEQRVWMRPLPAQSS